MGLDIQIFGEKGGLRWASEQPNQAYWTPLGGRTEIIEKGEAGISEMAARLSRVPIAHPEGFPLAVANIYIDLAAAIRAEKAGLPLDAVANHFPKPRMACGRWLPFTQVLSLPSKTAPGWMRDHPCFGDANQLIGLGSVLRRITRHGNSRASG
jgi:hypothetical protein